MTDYPTIVRMARPSDEEAILQLAITNNRENGIAPLSLEKMRAMFRRAVEPTEQTPCVIGVIEDNGVLAATIGIVLTQWWYSDQWHLEEIWNYVHPEYRFAHRNGGVGYGMKLLEFAKWVSESMGYPLLIGVLSTTRTAAKVRLYQRQVPSVGALFLYQHEGAVQ